MSDYATFKDLAGAVHDFVAALAIVLGGSWVLWRFVLFRDGYPRIQFELGFTPIARQDGQVVAEVEAILANTGQVRHFIREFTFDLLVLGKTDRVLRSSNEKVRGQTEFRKVIDGQALVTGEMEWTFVDPGVRQRYSYVTAVPEDTASVLMIAKFKYLDGSEFHSAQRVWSLKVTDPGTSG